MEMDSSFPGSQNPWSQPSPWSSAPPSQTQTQTQTQPVIYCEGCGSSEHESDEDGCYYCCACGALIPDLRVTEIAIEDIRGVGVGGEGGLYSMRHKVQNEPSQPSAAALPTREEVLRGLAEAEMTEEQREKERERQRELEMAYGFDEKVYEPRDFGWRGKPDAESVVNVIRLRYVQGMQLMVQLRCEALVERHGVSPLICGIVGGIWLRYVAATRVFDDGWANKVIEEAEAALDKAGGLVGKEPTRNKWEPHSLHGRRAIYIWLGSLKKMIPHDASLAISFLACHVARQPVLPSDIVKWALEAKLPYISAFIDIDSLLGRPSENCPLRSRALFKPKDMVGSWNLESTAGYIADSIGLHLPPVNFYAIASRYLSELSLPLEKVLPMACRVYEWSMPAELCLSKHELKLPTRVYVMAMLVVVIRILYNIQGQGVWERSLSDLCSPCSEKLDVDCKKQNGISKDVNHEHNLINANSEEIVPETKPGSIKPTQDSCKNTVELLHNLEKIYEKSIDTLDFAKDFKTYVKYCKDVISAGITKSSEEESLMERFWNMCKDDADDEPRTKIGSHNVNHKRFIEAAVTVKNIAKKPCAEKHMDSELGRFKEVDGAKDANLRKLKSDMELNGFNYLPPKPQQSSEALYFHYERKRKWGKLLFVAHADYYILLRACAKLAEVDCRILHVGVLLFEKRLAWMETWINESLVSLRNGSLEAMINLTEQELKDIKC